MAQLALFETMSAINSSLRGRHSKLKGQGVLGARETRGAPATQASLPAKNDSAELFVQGALKLSVSS